eukprot:g17078.t1
MQLMLVMPLTNIPYGHRVRNCRPKPNPNTTNNGYCQKAVPCDLAVFKFYFLRISPRFSQKLENLITPLDCIFFKSYFSAFFSRIDCCQKAV